MKEKLKNIWLTADLHLGESRFDLMGRPFKTTKEHDNTIINNHNSVVAPDDLVYVIGDVVYQKSPESLPLIKKMNGMKVLVRGNHDSVFTDDQLRPYFGYNIIPDGGGIETIIEGIKCYFTHYPSTGKSDRFNVCGHIHGAWKYQLNTVNVGVDVNHFYPVNSNKIPFYLNAIKNFYDEDVFAAYNPINKDYHKNGRGKEGSYFKK